MSFRYIDMPQIPASQLRQGNTVSDGTGHLTVNSVSENYCRCTFHHPHEKMVKIIPLFELRPVVVNKARLEKLGFYKAERNHFLKDGFPFVVYHDNEDLFQILQNDTPIASGNFLHHLQNLIQDLEIKEFRP